MSFLVIFDPGFILRGARTVKCEEINGLAPSSSDHFSQVCNPEMEGSATMSPFPLPRKKSSMSDYQTSRRVTTQRLLKSLENHHDQIPSEITA